MSSSIDKRIVEMQFDNAQFEKGISTSLKSLDNLEKGLKLDGASKGLENLGKTAAGMSFDGLQSGIYAVQQKFSALEVIGITALQRITNQAISTGESLVKSLSVDQIAAGFEKFGSKTSSVATLVAQGYALEDVNAQLDRLNWFTDETSYNFTDMVSNIAKFTASGKGLNESVTAMEGIANWAALSGQNAMTASRAMYQLSQAMGAGVMRKEDYKSIQNASMDTDEFRQKCLDAAVALGTLKKNSDDTYTSLVNENGKFTKAQFAEHLTEDMWFNSDVMMKVFGDYSSAVDQIYEYADEKGITASQAISELGDKVDSFGLKAFKAAQEARTWGDAVDSVKDAVSTGWMNTFELIFGNQEEATKLWTDLANAMYDVFASGAEGRNELLKEWKDAGGRDALIESFWNIWDAVSKVTGSIKEAFGEIFAPLTSNKLLSITDGLKKFTESLIVSDETADKLKRTFKGVFSVLDIFKKVLGTVGDAIAKLLGSNGIKDLGETLLNGVASLGDFLVSLNESFSIDGLSGMLDKIGTGISDLFSGVLNSAGGFSGAFGTIGDTISSVLGFIWNSFKTVFSWLKENISVKGIFGTIGAAFGMLTGKEIFSQARGITDFIERLTKNGKKSGLIKKNISEMFSSLQESLSALTTNIKVSSLVSVAAAIGILTASLNTLSKIDVGSALSGIGAMGAMFKILTSSLKSITKTLSKNGSKGLITASGSLILIAESMKVLADAMIKFSGMSLKEIAKGLISVGGGLLIFCTGLKLLNGIKIPLRTSIAILSIAKSCEMLGDAMAKFTEFSWDEIGRSLTAMGGALGELVIAMGVLNKVSGVGSFAGSVSILITVQSLSTLAEALSDFSKFSWDEIGHGLAAMGGALGEVSVALVAVSKLAGFSSLFAAGSITLVITGLDNLATALMRFGYMSWESIQRGLVGMGVSLGEVAGLTGILGKFAGLSSLFAAGSIRLVISGLDELADALGTIGGMSWDEIKNGLAGLGGALTEVAAITGIHGLVSGFSGIIGSGSILLAVQGLGDLADALKEFGSLSVDEINNGLAAMIGALSSIAVGGLLNTFSGFGAGAISSLGSALIPLADGIKAFADVEVPTDFATQLGHVASGVNTFMLAGWGAEAINTVSSGLGTLADSVSKWEGVTVPDGIGTQLSTLANGINTFMFSGLGASAIDTVASSLGTLADSVENWVGIEIPDGFSIKLGSLATGVNSFMFAGWGADNIVTLAPGLNDLADSVRKWIYLKIPDDLSTKLESLATGIKSFSFAFLAGWSMDTVTGPLGDLADSVKKWNGVRIPNKLDENLGSLANGVKSFSFAFLAGWSMDAITGPLGELADSVRKWDTVTIPDSIQTGLEAISTGLKSFSDISNISYAVTNMGNIAQATSDLANVNFTAVHDGILSITEALTKLGNIDLSTATNIGDISTAVETMISTFSTAIQNSAPTVSESFGSMLTTVINNSAAYQNMFYDNGQTLVTKVTDGFKAGNAGFVAAITASLSVGASEIYNYYNNWYTAGSFLTIGLAEGIRDGKSEVINAAAEVAKAAADKAKSTLQINSPSKVTYGFGRFFDLGMANGIYDYAGQVAKASETISNEAITAAQLIAENIAATMDEDLDYRPTIRPVLDMDDVDSGLTRFSTTFGGRSLNLASSIDRAMKAAPAVRATIDPDAAANQNGGTTNYNFTQNNYSPKALSRIDLYRQTNNQFAMMKERGK